MFTVAPSALVVDKGRRVLIRLQGRVHEISQEDLRSMLGLSAGPPGLGITIDSNRFHFEFADNQSYELSATQLSRRLAKQLPNKQ